MGIAITLIIVFILTFVLFFLFVYKDNKKEKENIFIIILSVALLSLMPTALIAFFLFVFLGSTTTINLLFSLNISTDQLIILAITLLVYLFSIDSILEKLVEFIIGKNLFYYLILMVLRIMATYTLALIIGLDGKNGFAIATGVSLIIFLLEAFYSLNKKNRKVNAHDG